MKKETRHRIRENLAQMPPEQAAAKSKRACATLAQQQEFRDAGVVMLYHVMAQELDVTDLIERCWADGKTALLPKVRWDPREMIAVPYRSLDDPMSVGRYNILEPADGEPWPADEIDLIVVPGLAFDARGRRLGKGGGFYDRFLAQPLLCAVTCAVAFAEQMVDAVATESHDACMDMLVTDEVVLRFR